MGKLHRKFNKHVCSANWRPSVSPTLYNLAPLMSNYSVFFRKTAILVQLLEADRAKMYIWGTQLWAFCPAATASPCPASPAARGTRPGPSPLKSDDRGGHGTGLPSSCTSTRRPHSPLLYGIRCLSQRLCLCVGTGYLGARECCYHSQSLMHALATRNRHPTATAWVSKRV